MSDVEMPALGESVTEGTVTRWLKEVGDDVAVDEPLLEVSTDKVDTEIPSPVAGTLQEILVAEDETVEVGAKLAVIGEGAAPGGGGDDASSDDAAASSGSDAGGSDAGADDTGGAGSDDDGSDDDGSDDDGSDDGSDDDGSDDDGSDDDGSQDEAAQPAAEETEREQPSEQEPSDDKGSGAPSSGGSGGGGTAVKMPALGESVTEGTVTRWLKAEGDEVAVDEPLLEVSTDKVDTEIPSPVAGTVQKILVAEDETVEVGTDLAMVGDGAGASDGGGSDDQSGAADSGSDSDSDSTDSSDEGQENVADEKAAQDGADPEAEEKTAPQRQSEQAPQQQKQPEQEPPQSDKPAQSEPEQAKEASTSAAPQTGSGSAAAPSGGKDDGAQTSAYVTPLVRKLAKEHDVDLSSLTGTGVGGRIRKQDVLEAAETAAAERARSDQAQTPAASPSATAPVSGASGDAIAALAAKRGTTEKMSRLRKVIATRMVESLQVSAQLTTVVEVDVTKIARLRDRAKKDFEAREGVKLSFLAFFALACVEALKTHPKVNSSIEDDQIVYHPQENLGVAVDTERGLLVPVIRDAGDLNIAGLARKIADLADRTRNNKITPDELGGGTFTLTNTGSRGALFDTPIINQPQVAILGTGSVVRRPVVVVDPDGGETIAIRSMVYLALSYDHRLVDGADAARFLASVKERLEEGSFDADLGL